MQRYIVFFIAGVFPLLFVGQFAPNMAEQLDFWLLWLIAMVLVGLPILLTESALSARSAQLPWIGMQKLTREADASLLWRVFALLSVFLSVIAAGSLISKISLGVFAHYPQLANDLDIPKIALAAGLTTVALILSLLKTRLLFVGSLLMMVGAMIALIDSSVAMPLLTEISLNEWAKAVVLALFSVGLGVGLYWFAGFSSSSVFMHSKKSLAAYILPIWLIQVLFGSFALLSSTALINPWSFAVSGLGMLLMAAFLFYYAGIQLVARFGLLYGVLALIILALAASMLPNEWLLKILMLSGLLSVLALSVFAGFIMKISHLRKTLNFQNEFRYNIWRVMVRIIVPLVVVVAMGGLVIEWLG